VTLQQATEQKTRLEDQGFVNITVQQRLGQAAGVTRAVAEDPARNTDYGLLAEYDAEGFHWKGEDWYMMWTQEGVDLLVLEVEARRRIRAEMTGEVVGRV
jgi:hypothetical protein